MKNYRIIKGKKIHINRLAAWSRQFTVKNNTIPKSDKKFYQVPWDTCVDKLTRFTSKNKLAGRTMIISDKPDEYGLTYHFPDYSWEYERHEQPKSLRKKYKKKYYDKCTHNIRKIIEHPSDYTKFKNYPYTLPKMNKVQYMEKLVEHKLAKWERKNPSPAEMFTEDVEKWKQLRESMKERFRDFVVSIYDPLLLTGRFVMNKSGTATYTEEKVAEIKDINGEGHKVNELKKDSKLLKKAQKITNEIHAKRANLVATNLRDHKKQRGRIILPQAA